MILGEFLQRQQEEWKAGDKYGIIRREDNLYPEGNFQTRPENKWQPADKPRVIRRTDNLTLGSLQKINKPIFYFSSGLQKITNYFPNYCQP